MRQCPKCKGSGKIVHPGLPGTWCTPPVPQFEQKCNRCGGKGKVER